jgi:hypothetical protein
MLKYMHARTDMAVRLRDGIRIQTDYDRPITIVKYVHDTLVVVTPFGAFILSPTSVAYLDGGQVAVADIRRDGGGGVRLEPRQGVERIRDIARSYLPDSLPPQLQRCGDKIYLGDVEVGRVYVLG